MKVLFTSRTTARRKRLPVAPKLSAFLLKSKQVETQPRGS